MTLYYNKYLSSVLQVLAVFQEVGVNKILYFLVFGESLLNGVAYFKIVYS